MKNYPTKIFAAVVIIMLIVGVGCFYVNLQNKPKPKGSQATISTLNTFCNCDLLTNDYRINAATGVAYTRIPASKLSFVKTLQYLAPSKKQEAILTTDNRSLYLLQYPEQTLTLLYTTPASQQIRSVFWTANENSLVVELIDPNSSTSDGTEGVITSVVELSISSKTVQTVLDVATTLPASKNGFTFIWSSDDLQHLVYVIGNMTEGVTWYRSDNGKASEIKENISSAIYMNSAISTTPDSGQQSILLWLDGQGLHSYHLETATTTDYPITTWSDGPVSLPSPDGKSVIYVKKISGQEAGVFTRLDLVTQHETTLSATPFTENINLGQSVWSPDGTKLLLDIPPLQEVGWISTRTISSMMKVQNQYVDSVNNIIRAAIVK